MEGSSIKLWLFDQKGNITYSCVALFLLALSIAFPILFALGPVVMAFSILAVLTYIIFGLAKVFAYQLEFEFLNKTVRVKPIHQARFSRRLFSTEIPYAAISKVESYGIEGGRSSYYHFKLTSDILDLRLKSTSALGVSSVTKNKALGLKFKEISETKSLNFPFIGEEKVWRSSSMKVLMWTGLTVLLGLVVFTVYLLFNQSFELSDGAYLMIFLFEFFFLTAGFLYYWKKFRKYNP